MTMNAGVWIDHHKAVILLITEQGEEHAARLFLIDTKRSCTPRVASERATLTLRNDFVAEDKLERKAESHLNKYYDEVIACLHNADSIWILGQAKPRAS